jgi:cytochrome c556
MIRALVALLVWSAISTSLVERAPAQSPPSRQATLGQLMKGTLYPSSNVIFAAQDENPADVPRAKDPNMATDLLTSSYGKWEAVENSALAIVEVADLLMLPGRKCANGADVPLANPDWARFVQELRDAGMTAYAAAKARSQDKITDASDVMTKACSNCHLKYRDRRVGPAERCK